MQSDERSEFYFAVVAQSVEHVIGNDEVGSSILPNGSNFKYQMKFESLNKPEEISNLSIEIEGEYEEFIPNDFRDNPFLYFEKSGVNIRPGLVIEKDASGNIKDDPTAVKRLPIWSDGKRNLEVVAKRVNPRKSQIAESGDPLYEYNIIKYLKSLDLPAPNPIGFVEQGDKAIFLTEKIPGLNLHDLAGLSDQGWTGDEIAKIEEQAVFEMKNLESRFAVLNIKRGWHLKDMVLDIDLNTKSLRNITPTDFERTKVFAGKNSEPLF